MFAIILARRPVATITASQSLAIRHFCRTLHVDKSCRKYVIIRILIEEYLHIKIPMPRINRIADGGIYWL